MRSALIAVVLSCAVPAFSRPCVAQDGGLADPPATPFEDLAFIHFFDSQSGEPSARLAALDGKRLKLVGLYMVQEAAPGRGYSC